MTKRSLPKEKTVHEYERIVDFSFNQRALSYTIRFLSGDLVVLKVADLPKVYGKKSAEWAEAEVDNEQCGLKVPTRRSPLLIPSHIIHCNGNRIS